MSFYFFKFLLFITQPITLLLIFLALSINFISRNKIRAAKQLLIFTFVIFILLSLPLFSDFFIGSLENQFPGLRIAESPSADAIVVLGGTVSNIQPPRVAPEEPWGDRLSAAAKLFHKKKAPLVYASGGVPYTPLSGIERTESTDMKDYLIDLNVPTKQIIEENRSRNTFENVTFLKELIQARGGKQIILVTSAFHMPRAVYLFKKTGLSVIPFPTDFRSNTQFTLDSLIPTLDALKSTSLGIKERLGLIKYTLFPSLN
ncbi:MAG: YdcF family protein [Deltaproteobacteria bacterium]|nr:YdcF family protein [Deltaproteobacteria bacterium]MBM4317487.1 YdcF family protein [Deltaproteobacteria bacterium]